MNEERMEQLRIGGRIYYRFLVRRDAVLVAIGFMSGTAFGGIFLNALIHGWHNQR